MSRHLLEGLALFTLAVAGIRVADRRTREQPAFPRRHPWPPAQQPHRGRTSRALPAVTDRPSGGLLGAVAAGFGIGRAGTSHSPARWARNGDLAALVVRSPQTGRVVIGRHGHRLIAAEPGHSLLVVGPTQSGKTTGLAAPAIREWQGPVVAASVKGDLARLTIEARRGHSEVLVYDPLGTTGLERAAWSPLGSCMSWNDARRIASDLSGIARDAASTMTDGDFWYAMAAKLLAPLLLAAATNGLRMSDVVRWVDDQDLGQALDLLQLAGAEGAVQALHATIGRDERQRSAVFTTTETVIEAFAEPGVAECESPGSAVPRSIEVNRLLDENQILYICAPTYDQRRLRPLFATLVSQVIAEAYRRSMATGHPLDPPLLVVLDEAANVAPLAELDVLASTAAGHGVQLITVWQDLAQLNARYGQRAPSVVNNQQREALPDGHRGSGDPRTCEPARRGGGPDGAVLHLRPSRVALDDRRFVTQAAART